MNTHLYGAHLASGGVVLPEHDVGRLRRGPRARGGHDVEPRGRGHAGPLPRPGRPRPAPWSRRATRSCSTRSARWATSWARSWATASGRGSSTTAPARRWTTASWPSCSRRAAEVGRRVTDALRRGGAQRTLPRRRRRRGRPRPGQPQDPRRCRPRRTWPRTCTGWWRAATARWPGSTAPGATSGCASPPSTSGPALAGMLWGEVTAVLTSATIPPRIVERVGLEGFPTEELNVGSPFDYRSHALLYVARHLPDRRAPGAEEALHEELAQLLEAAGGRTLALFTSRRATRGRGGGAGARAALHPPAAGRPAQGPAARGVRRATRPPASSPRSASGRGSTSPAAPCRS